MDKKYFFLATIAFAFLVAICKDSIDVIAQEIDKDVQTCLDNQDCISTIDKHLINVKQLYDQLKNYHTNHIPYTFSFDNMQKLLSLNFVPGLIYLFAKLYNADTKGPGMLMVILSSAWGFGQWNDYNYRTARLIQLEGLIKLLENKKQEVEQEKL